MMDKKHEMICDLKRIAVDLGHVPSRRDFRLKTIYPKFWVESVFGGWTPFLHAAGMTPEKEKPKDIFATDIKKLLETESKRQRVKSPGPYQREDILPEGMRILVVGDTHFPFVDPDAVSALYVVAESLRPTVIVQVGDLYDMFAHSKFPRTHLTFDPKQEIELGFQMASEMWARLRKICPTAEFHQLLGNHDSRPLKRILEAYPQGEIFFSIEKWFRFESVTTYFDTREEVILGNIIYQHGFRSGLGQHRDHNLQNTVCGHSHVGGVSYRQIDGKILWELNAGFLGDASSKALSYTPQKITKWTLGCGFIDEFGPRFIPF